MRIICPNCAAQYEVEDAAIPPEGRDLQCSGCGHAWFQPGDSVPDAPTPAPPTPGSSAAGPPAPGPATPDPSGSLAGGGADPAPPRPPLDPTLREMLRAEAEREARARRAEAAAPPAGPEADPPAADPPASPARADPARDLPDDAAPDTPPERPARPAGPADRPASRAAARRKGDRLPAIDEVDPELGRAIPDGAAGPERGAGRAAAVPVETAAPEADAAAQALARRRGFRLGFLSVLALAAVAAGLYLQARGASDPPALLVAYADALDLARLRLAVQIDAVMRRLTELMAGAA